MFFRESLRAAVTVVVLLQGASAYAQTDAQKLAVFDANFYLNKYPDLKAAFGNDAQAAQQHWLQNGLKEGRDASPAFSIGGYRARYPDLQRAFGYDYPALLRHWYDNGIKEKRDPRAAGTYMADPNMAPLDPNFYLSNNVELPAAIGMNVPRLVEHWLTYGIPQGRAPNGAVAAKQVSLDTTFYADRYPDLKQAFGYDAGKLFFHWMNNGRVEGRSPNLATYNLMLPAPRSANGLSVLRLGDYMKPGDYMISNNRRYILAFQTDANLVVYETDHPSKASDANRRWFQHPQSFDTKKKYFMVLQPDGHFCTYEGSSSANQGRYIGCVPDKAGGPIGRYFVALQDDGNLVVYKGQGPDDNRGWIWDRITTLPSKGFNFKSIVENVDSVVRAGAAAIVYASNEVAHTTVDVSNKVANTTASVAVTVGREVEQGGQIVGREVVRNGEIVGYAVANAAVEAWNFLNNSCGAIGRKVFPIDAYFKGASTVANAVVKYGNTGGGQQLASAEQCFDWAQDGFYCAMPKELGKLVSQAGSMPGNVVNLSTKIFNEAKSKDCLIAGASTIMAGALGMEMCAMTKVVVNDAKGAYACYAAAEAKGIMAKFVPGGKTNGFPSQTSCTSAGQLALQVAEKVVTDDLSDQVKLAAKSGKSAALVAEQLMVVYSVAGQANSYQNIVDELHKLPECN
ncbi:MAG TPA: hypothetical protein VN089_11330 [Duganella sp.]|nr:hypothetical protein [Duganella sp.]